MTTKIKVIKYPYVSEDQVRNVLLIDEAVFPDRYKVPLATYVKMYEQNQRIFSVATIDDKAVGYACLLPVTYELFQRLRAGEACDVVLKNSDIIPYKHGTDYKGFIRSVVVLPEYKNQGVEDILIEEVLHSVASYRANENITFSDLITEVADKEMIPVFKANSFQPLLSTPRDTLLMTYKQQRRK